jgi:hypothetical protein
MRIFLCLLFSGFAFAQDLPCATLLGALPATRFNDLTSFEAKFSYEEGPDIVNVRQVEDISNQRSYYETTESSSSERTIVHYEGDTGTLERNGQTEVAPARENVDILPFFDVFLSQQIFAKAELLSCDGQQSLETPEGTLEGEAITVKLEDKPGQLFFDEAGHIIASREENEVVVFDNRYEDDLLVTGALRIYYVLDESVSDESATLERTITFELVNYDQPIDASLFGETLPCTGLLETFNDLPAFTSLETTTTYTQDPNQPSDYKVVDFTGQRVYWEVTFNGVKTIYRLVNGEVTGVSETNGKQETTEVSEGIRISLESTFSNNTSFRELADKAVVLSCDGEQSYSGSTGEIVRGQQIMVADKTNPDSESAKLLFDDAGDFIGNYVDRPEDSQDVLLVNSDRLEDESGVVVLQTNATYLQEDGSFELLSKTTTKTLSYNQPIDETLFEP